MKITAIIAEYNPLHGGHQYHIQQTRQITNADYIVTILSGDFVQRGLPAVEEKFARAGKALEAGSDLVLELSLPYAISSAEGFAFGGVSLTNQLGCVDYLSFGLEEEKNLEALKELARLINANESRSESGSLVSADSITGSISQSVEERKHNGLRHQESLRNSLKEGANYPAAAALAAAKAFPGINTDFLTRKGNSNTILALEYLRALDRLGSSITPVTITRHGESYLSGYKPDVQTSAFASAAAVKVDAPDFYPSATALRAQLKLTEPSDSPLLFPTDFSSLLHYKLLSLRYEDLLQYREMTPQLAHKIINSLPQYENYEQFANLLWSKDTTCSRICRELLYILLDIKKDAWDVHTQAPYARILGFRKSAAPLLHLIRETSSVPLISKLADAPSALPDKALSLLELDIRASQIYDSVRYHKCGERLPGEYQKQIVIV